jgi:plastocyanin
MRTIYLVSTMIMLALAPLSITAATVTVHIVNFDFVDTVGGSHFDPTVFVGDTVHWVWDSNFHSTTSVTGQVESWDSGINDSGFTFDHTFTNAGDFAYYCIPHGQDNGNGTASGMSGIVHVVPAGVIPEPASWSLMAAGAAALGLVRWRRRG